MQINFSESKTSNTSCVCFFFGGQGLINLTYTTTSIINIDSREIQRAALENRGGGTIITFLPMK